MLPIILCSAVVSGVSYMLQLIGAVNLPATVLYPIVSGGSIIFSTIAGMICFKERPNLYQKIGVVLCFVGTCLFL
ncbi:MAG: EamA family transporter [Tyzzerella sp.]|nr:EamA family transporter [Tyzzerella sp.]